MTLNRNALGWLAAFAALVVIATNRPTVGIVLAVVSAVILEALTWVQDFRKQDRNPPRPN